MNKISTKYFNTIFKYFNTFEKEQRHPAFGSQFETVIDTFQFISKELKGRKNLNILDLGSGLGNVLFIAQSILGKSHKFVGVDHNQSYNEVAQFIGGNTFHILPVDLMSDRTKKLILQADIVYCYTPLNTKNKMDVLYQMITNNMKSGSYFICNDTNENNFIGMVPVIKFEGLDCCNKTNIRVLQKIN